MAQSDSWWHDLSIWISKRKHYIAEMSLIGCTIKCLFAGFWHIIATIPAHCVTRCRCQQWKTTRRNASLLVVVFWCNEQLLAHLYYSFSATLWEILVNSQKSRSSYFLNQASKQAGNFFRDMEKISIYLKNFPASTMGNSGEFSKISIKLFFKPSF